MPKKPTKPKPAEASKTLSRQDRLAKNPALAAKQARLLELLKSGKKIVLASEAGREAEPTLGPEEIAAFDKYRERQRGPKKLPKDEASTPPTSSKLEGFNPTNPPDPDAEINTDELVKLAQKQRPPLDPEELAAWQKHWQRQRGKG